MRFQHPSTQSSIHLGHFALVQQVSHLLNPGAKLVVVSSEAHRFANLDLDDPNFESAPFSGRLAHARSKTANVLFALEFDRRNQDQGLRAMAVNPGPFATPGLAPSSARSVRRAAATTVWCGVVASAAVAGRRYCEDCRVAEVVERRTARFGVRDYAVDGEQATRLWAWSQGLLRDHGF